MMKLRLRIFTILFALMALCFNTVQAQEASVEAPDTESITTVKEYKFVPRETLPPVQGTSAYQWDEKEKIVVFPINVWAGWLPIIAANNGFAPNEESVFFKKYGFKVNLKLIDDPVAARDAYASGNSHVLWGTLDMMVLFAPELMKDSRTAPRIFQQIDWSCGGDGIVARTKIRSIGDLKGKTIVYAQNSPSQYFISNLLINAGIGLDEVTHKYTSTAFEAATAFVSDPQIDACVSWAPDIYTIPEKVAGTRILTTTAEANKLIADVWAIRADFARDKPEIVRGLVAGIFEGMDMLANPTTKAQAFQWMADGYGMKVEDVTAMEADSHPTNFAENREFFLNANNPTNFERTWKSIAYVYQQAGLIKETIAFNQVMDFSIISDFEKTGLFKHHQDNYISKFVPTTYKKVNAEAPIITQTVRINFYPNSANIYEPAHDITGLPIINTLYDPNIDATMEKVARLVGAYDRAVVAIVGHTDSSMKGKIPDKIVKDLSLNRAEAVKKALVDKFKFDPKKFVVEGDGWDKPADSDNPMNQALNRRVEISVFPPESN
ncbi:MAG: phosphate ABC transporter substrate-binding/OmpA family protein [Candidatus Riflebacteria bacterium]|nr:phosphate ABC transporter substrate-binding/OmpA family protein [Candidatus Riflebacteria bacterium]